MYILLKKSQTDNTRLIKMIALICFCVMLDIVLHVLASPYSTMPMSPNFSVMAKLIGVEISASLWAFISFSSFSFVFFCIYKTIPGKNIIKGLKYGFAIAILWLFAMLEGVPLFGNAILNELIVGLCDASPVFLLGVLLSFLISKEHTDYEYKPMKLNQKIKAIGTFTWVFLIGRYFAYFLGLIKSGYQNNQWSTLWWTILMGAGIGISCILIENTENRLPLRLRAIKFGFLIFGLNWASFLIFMPLLFSDFLIDSLSRIMLDSSLVMIGYYFAFYSKEKRDF